VADEAPGASARRRPGLLTVAREWGWIGCIGFGGPPAHIALLRQLCVERRRWLEAREFEDAIVACNLLPGPASTQLAIFCAWRVRGRPGALVGGAAFILPGLIVILALAALFLGSPPDWIRGAGAGAGAAVAAVAVHAGSTLLPDSRRRAGHPIRWSAYLLAGAAGAATIGPWLVLVLLGCGVLELSIRNLSRPDGLRGIAPVPLLAAAGGASGGLLALAWVALKVGALSYGGGFVIIPLMQFDAVDRYHWLTDGEFLNAVALGQVTPGPVVHTVAVVGYGAAGLGGGLLAALVAFSPSFASSSAAPATSNASAPTSAQERSSAAQAPPPSAPSSARRSRWRALSRRSGNTRSSPAHPARSSSCAGGSSAPSSSPALRGLSWPWPEGSSPDEVACNSSR
jgi:chromate transporter